MSAIRPDLPAVPSAAPAPAGVRQAQAAFFRAALAQAQPSSPQRAEAAPSAALPRNAAAAEPDRAVRPGSLLDIRV